MIIICIDPYEILYKKSFVAVILQASEFNYAEFIVLKSSGFQK